MQVVILCGGKGTRSYPYTDQFPKPLMPIGGRPILVHLMQSYAAQGCTKFVLAAGYKKEVLVDYFDGRFSSWQVQIVDTGENSDTGERLQRCLPYVGNRFFANYGDGLGDVDISALLRAHENSKALATLTVVPLRSQYGVVHFGDDRMVQRFDEKPIIYDRWINAGFFVFERAAFDYWVGNCLETEILPGLAKRSMLHAYCHQGFWKSMDTSKDQQEMEKLLVQGNQGKGLVIPIRKQLAEHHDNERKPC